MTTSATPPDYSWQDEGAEWLGTHKIGLLGDDPGLGKTRQALLAARLYLPADARILVLAPAMLLNVWRTEQARWAPDLDITFSSYSGLPRLNPDFVPGVKNDKGVNPEPRFLPSPKRELKGPWDVRILDEAHNVTNRKAIWTKACEGTKADRTWLLTGTPIPNWAHELFILLRLMHPGDRRYTSYWRWIETWFKQFQIPRKGMRGATATKIGGLLRCTSECPKESTCEHWAEFYTGNDLDHLMLRRTRKQVKHSIPPLTEQVIECPMTDAQARVYNDLKEQFYALIEQTGTEVMAFNTAALTTKLSKACTGIEVLDPKAKGGSGKLDMVEALLDTRRGHQVVIFCQFKDTVRAVSARAKALGLVAVEVTGDYSVPDRNARIDQFQAGEADVLIGTLSVIREGLTLTAADTCIFVERSWNPNKNDQARDRLQRIGQVNPVTAITLVTPRALDGHMTSVLKSKTLQQIKTMTAGEFSKLL